MLFDIIKNLYTNKSSKWILGLDDECINSVVIQKCLIMDDRLRSQVRWLDKYVFVLPPKMFLSLVWSIIPKSNSVPFNKFIKVIDENEKYDFILFRVRKYFKLSDNDYKCNKSRLLLAIKKDIINWFKFFGIRKAYWQGEYIDFREIKK